MGYTDLTDVFEPDLLIVWQNLKELADNDAFKRIPSGTKMLFFQASAPTGWTKQTGLNNRAIRVVSGAGGSTGGGSDFLGTPLDLAHVHTTPSHDHSWPSHMHESFFTATPPLLPHWVIENFNSADSDGSILHAGVGAGTGRTNYNGDYSNVALTTGGTAPSLNTTLGSITLKYYDAIVCTKD